MLSFVVFDELANLAGEGPVDLALRHAHLIGADDVPLTATLSQEGDLIRCLKHTPDAAALSLVCDAGDCGRLALRTCLLPERDQPYLLSLELARRRIMLFLTKLEEWLNCDLRTDDPSMLLFERARAVFTQALACPRDAKGDYSPEQDRLALEALRLSIEAGERLSVLVAEAMLTTRLHAAAKGAVPIAAWALGCAVSREHASAALQKVAGESFDFIVKPMRWTELEPDEGEYDWTKTDKWVEWAVRAAKTPVAAGPVIDFRAGRTPEWLSIWSNDYDTLREVVFEHLKKVVTRYRKAINRWTVASGLHLNAAFPLTLEQLMDLTRLCVMVVKKLHPTAKVTLEIDQPFGERYARETRSIPPLLYAEMVVQQGIAIDAFGLRLQAGDGHEGRATRDMMELAALLDTYSQFDRPLQITALGAPSEPPPKGSAPGTPGADDDLGALAPVTHEGGWWRSKWSQERQADWLTHAVSVCLSRHFVQSVCWQEFYDSASGAPEMPAGGLITAEGKAKVALRRFTKIRQAMRQGQAPTRAAPLEDRAPAWTEAGEG